MPRYWVIAPYDSTKKKIFDVVWNYDKSNGTIAVGWGQLGDILNSNLPHEEYVIKYEQLYPNGSTYDRDSFWRFYKEISPGDTIIARKGRKEILAIGTVAARAYYDAKKGNERIGNLSGDVYST